MTFKYLALVLSSLLLISCGSDGSGSKAVSTKAEKRGKQSIRAAGTAAAANVNKPSDRNWARVYLDASNPYNQNQSIFQEQIVKLLEPQFKEKDVGRVMGADDSSLPDSDKHDTGVAFWGKGISFSAGFDPSRNDYAKQENLFNTETASLRLSIFREKVNAQDKNLIDIEEIPLHFNDGEREDSGKLIDSVIEQNVVQLIFADAFGKVNIWGTFDKDNFVGQVWFKTDAIDQENTGQLKEVQRNVELLGKFSVRTCGFFNCTK